MGIPETTAPFLRHVLNRVNQDFSIHVSRSVATSQSYLSQEERVLQDAAVRLRIEDGEFITPQYEKKYEKKYDNYIDVTGKLKLVPGKTYYLEENEKIVFVELYDKNNKGNEDRERILNHFQ